MNADKTRMLIRVYPCSSAAEVSSRFSAKVRTRPHQMKRGVPLRLDAVMVAVHAVERPVWRAAFLLPSAAHGPQVDSQGLAFLIEMTPLQPQRLGGIRHALMMAFQLRQDLLALESVRALGQRAGLRRGGGVGLRFGSRQRETSQGFTVLPY